MYLGIRALCLYLNLKYKLFYVVKLWFLFYNKLNFFIFQPQVPLQLPCYDLTPVTISTVYGYLPKVNPPYSGKNDFHGLTGSVYKTRERIHRNVLICDY